MKPSGLVYIQPYEWFYYERAKIKMKDVILTIKMLLHRGQSLRANITIYWTGRIKTVTILFV